MIFDSSWLRSGSVVLSALGLSVIMAACGGAGETEPNANISSPAPQSSPDVSPEIPATVSSPSEVAGSSGDRPNSAVYPGMEIIGVTEDEGLNIFFGGLTERCSNPVQNSPDCSKIAVVEYAVGKERMTAEVNCYGTKTIGNYRFQDGTYGEGMYEPDGGIAAVVNRACALLYKEGPVEDATAKDEPAGEPGYVGYDIVGQTESGEDVYFIASQPGCVNGVGDCDRRTVTLVIGEANSSAVVFCSTGNFNELTIDGTLVSYLMQPKTGVYATVVDRVCSE